MQEHTQLWYIISSYDHCDELAKWASLTEITYETTYFFLFYLNAAAYIFIV